MANVRGFWMGSENCNQFCAAVSRCMAKRTIIDGPVVSKVWINVVALQLLFDLLKNVTPAQRLTPSPALRMCSRPPPFHVSRQLLDDIPADTFCDDKAKLQTHARNKSKRLALFWAARNGAVYRRKKPKGGHLDSIDPAEASSCLSRLFHLIKTLLANHYLDVALFSHKGFAQWHHGGLLFLIGS